MNLMFMNLMFMKTSTEILKSVTSGRSQYNHIVNLYLIFENSLLYFHTCWKNTKCMALMSTKPFTKIVNLGRVHMSSQWICIEFYIFFCTITVVIIYIMSCSSLVKFSAHGTRVGGLEAVTNVIIQWICIFFRSLES